MSVPPSGAILAGKYALRRRLGSGGYGSVYEGENVDLGKKVAIKLIDRKHNKSTEAIARFRREARASARIESANIVQVFDVGEDPTFGLYMVMELLRGEDLRQKLDRVEKLPVEGALDFAHQIACGLAKAHSVGVLHRDLKPANVFLHAVEGEGGSSGVTVKIVDFGIAKLIAEPGAPGHDARDAQPLTSFGQTMGTPQYMAPEQVQGFPFDHRVDIWALGALLYEMLAGRPAFALLPTFQETAVAIVTQPPRSLSEVAPWVPAPVAEVVTRALVRDPKERIPDAVTFAEMLVAAYPPAFADGRGAARNAALPRSSLRPAPTSLPPVSVTPVSKPRSKPKLELVSIESGEHDRVTEPRVGASRRWAMMIVVVVLLAGSALLGVAAMRAREKRAPTPHPALPTEPRSAEVHAIESAAPSPSVSTSAPPPKKAKPTPPPKPSFGAAGVSSEY
jgi:serine/threonine-protein kinase